MNDFLSKLHKYRALQIDKIEFLHSPDDFYNRIISELQQSEEAYICTLYIGTGQKCEKLLKIIQDRKLNNKKTRVVVDKNRAIRTENFVELIKHYEIEDQFVLCENGSLSIFPKKLKELFGVLHSKIYIFDDVVLISGANLEDAYFCDRIDRYLVIKDEALALELYNEHFLLHDPESETKIVSSKPQAKSNGNTYIIPYNRENEIEMLESIFEYEYDSKYISTAYLNLTQEHIRVFKDKNIDMIIARAVESMFKYFRLSNMVADNYLINAKKAVTALTDLKIHEYCQPGTTYHCKGLWCFRDDFVVTVTGSSNYNYRSLYRDIETNFLIITNDLKIIDGLSSELKIILDHAVDSDTKDILDREVGTLSKLSNLFLRYYL